jgi:hypothetical protein
MDRDQNGLHRVSGSFVIRALVPGREPATGALRAGESWRRRHIRGAIHQMAARANRTEASAQIRRGGVSDAEGSRAEGSRAEGSRAEGSRAKGLAPKGLARSA